MRFAFGPGLKPRLTLQRLTYGLKPVPFKAATYPQNSDFLRASSGGEDGCVVCGIVFDRMKEEAAGGGSWPGGGTGACGKNGG